jgi:hypothetical protein
MMILWSKHLVAIPSEEEKKNFCVDGPIIASLRYRMPSIFMRPKKWWQEKLTIYFEENACI